MRHVLLLLIVAACTPRPMGWFRADKAPTAEQLYDERFEPIVLSADGPCEAVNARQGDPKRLVIVLVHGIGGEGDEMHGAVPILAAAKPSSMFMFRYGAFEKRDALVERLAAGLSRLAACIPDVQGRLLVLAHSAGGVLSSRAVSKVTPPPQAGSEPWLTLITVASPLAGTSSIFASERTPENERPMMLEMGLNIRSYPEAAPGVRVFHLRTSPKSDGFQRPSGGHTPNDPSVGVPGAQQLNLPDDLDHPQSLIFTAKHIADGSWLEWLSSLPPAR